MTCQNEKRQIKQNLQHLKNCGIIIAGYFTYS